MTKRKFKSYSLWVKFQVEGWQKVSTCIADIYWVSLEPKEVLTTWANSRMALKENPRYWMVLPEGRQPAEMRKRGHDAR